MLDTQFLAHVCDSGALGDLKLGIHLLPVIGHCEDGICAFEGGGDGRFVVQIGLLIWLVSLSRNSSFHVRAMK